MSQITAEAGVHIANYNCPGQIVISGEARRVEKAIGLAVFTRCAEGRASGGERRIPYFHDAACGGWSGKRHICYEF